MRRQPRPNFQSLLSHLRHLLRILYPSFSIRRNAARPLSILSISFVLSLVFMADYLVIPFTLLPHLSSAPIPTLFWLILFSWSSSCTLISYLLTALANPGHVPSSWRPLSWRDQPAQSQYDASSPALTDPPQRVPVPPPAVTVSSTAMLLANGQYRFCKHCKVFKPDRAHHCSTCHECVLLMDHHCPFTGNSCVGLLNRKFFILFLYYATLSCTLVAVLTPRALMSYIIIPATPLSTANVIQIVALMMTYLLCALHALALCPFAVFHTYLALRNRTTIENHEPRHASHTDVLRRSDRGWLDHWNLTFGPVRCLWFVPVTYGRACDGISWLPSECERDADFRRLLSDLAAAPDENNVTHGDHAV